MTIFFKKKNSNCDLDPANLKCEIIQAFAIPNITVMYIKISK